MKFGDTLYQRSVPKWAAYNVNYNEIKRLIKDRTSAGVAVPVSIPTSSQNRWEALEKDLFVILREQYDNVGLFLKSKYGEIDRRLSYLERQVKTAQKAARLPYTNPSLQNRKYRKLLEDAEAIGQDIQNLTRFAGVQKTAVRKILKKYRKWTGSISLQTRLDNEVFSSGQLSLDYAHPLDRLATLHRIITLDLLGLQPERRASDATQARASVSSPASGSTSTVADIRDAEQKSAVALDAALATIPYGKSSGSATYWIHPDNLDEAQALLLRHVREICKSDHFSRRGSALSLASETSDTSPNASGSSDNYIAFFDNPQRFVQDASANRPSKVALSARWCQSSEAVATLSNLAPWSSAGTIVEIRRKDMLNALDRNTIDVQQGRSLSINAGNIKRIQEYLSEHRDVKPQARMHSTRSRYASATNSAKVGVWATLDSDIVWSPFRNDHSGLVGQQPESGDTFPHSVLEVRWEFCHTPELVRAFDNTHLAERVRGFTLESAAIHTFNTQLGQPQWSTLLEKDIRKVPLTTKISLARQGSSTRIRTPVAGSSSGPSSTDGPTESIYTTQDGHSSATSLLSPVESAKNSSSPSTAQAPPPTTGSRKKRARIDAQSPPPRMNRYWNEFDDGDEDVNPQSAYTIYVDPDESFPGAKTAAKVLGAMYRSLRGAGSRVSSMLPLRSPPDEQKKANERSRLLRRSRHSSDADAESSSSDSDSSPTVENTTRFGTFVWPGSSSRPDSRPGSSHVYRPKQVLTPRQKVLERTYFMSYTGLFVLAYIILFICGVLVGTGRKRAIIEIDIAMIAGLATAETCAVLSMLLVWMKRSPMGIVHWCFVTFAIAGIVGIGVWEIVAVVKKPT